MTPTSEHVRQIGNIASGPQGKGSRALRVQRSRNVRNHSQLFVAILLPANAAWCLTLNGCHQRALHAARRLTTPASLQREYGQR